MRLWGKVLAAATCLLAATHAHAEDEASGLHPLGAELHGFVSQGFMLSARNNYLMHSRRGSFEFTEVGLNVTRSIGDQLSVGMQLFARDLGTIGNYKPQFDWFYLDYHFRDWLGLRAGRTKLPYGLYNEQSDIDSARVPILMPQSVYSITSRDFLLAQTGFELYGYVPLGGAGAFDYRLYGGTIFIDSTTLASPDVTVNKIDVPYVTGTRGLWRTPLDGLTVGGSAQLLRIELDYSLSQSYVDGLKTNGVLPPDFGNRLKYKLPAFLWVGSLEYAAHDVTFAAEYSRWRYDYRVRPSIPFLPDGNVTSTRWYVMGSYRAATWFSPGVYYSVSQSGTAGPNTRDKYQQDLATTARFDITQNWLVKLEGHYMRGTANLSSALNANIPTAKLPREWGVFMLKTTAYF
jgi:hypothetical protein